MYEQGSQIRDSDHSQGEELSICLNDKILYPKAVPLQNYAMVLALESLHINN